MIAISFKWLEFRIHGLDMWEAFIIPASTYAAIVLWCWNKEKRQEKAKKENDAKREEQHD